MWSEHNPTFITEWCKLLNQSVFGSNKFEFAAVWSCSTTGVVNFFPILLNIL